MRLIDITEMQGNSSITKDYNDAELFYKAGFQHIHQIAVLDKPERKKMNDFFETTSRNRWLQFAPTET